MVRCLNPSFGREFPLPLLGQKLILQEQASEDAPAELSAVVDELLSSLTSKFSTVSSEIFAKSESLLLLFMLPGTGG